MSAPSPGWNPDPLGRHEYRYWDGQDWTDDVSDDGVTSVDPIDPPAPAGGEPTAPFDPTQQYTPPGQAEPYGAPPPGYQAGPPAFGQGPAAGGPGYGGPGGFGSGPTPPGQPAKSGPPVPLIVGGVVVLLAVIAGLVFVLTSGDDDDDPVATDDVTTTTAADDVTTTTAEDEDADEDEDATTTTTEGSSDPTTTDVFSLQVGDCFLDPDATDTVAEVPLVPCDEPHDNEVFNIHVIDAAERPSDDEMSAIVEEECTTSFETYVGTPYASSELYLYPMTPSEGSWEQGDREVVCYLYDPDGQITGSAEGSNR